jgi:hypothetical protein
MGAVYLARESALDRMVAIKVLHATASTGDGQERFRREARTAAKLTHPSIVPLHTFGEAEGLLYFVMGYVRGESLADRLRREGRLPPDDVRRILVELADALDYAHRHGVVHRDVKPDNILLEDESGRAMLTDFGIARAVELGGAGGTLTTTGALVGTPQYMSPEQANAEKTLDGRSDLYSLGVVGYAMLTGHPPFSGDNAWALLAQHAVKAPAPLADVAPGVPEDLASAVMKCLEKNRAQRWPDGRRLRDALAIDVSDGGALPHELQQMIGMGIQFLLALFIVGTLVWTVVLQGGRIGPYSWWMIALLPLVMLPSAFSVVRSARRGGHSWRRILRVTFWQPGWWPFWWPATLSRPGGIWPRLPRSLQLLRIAFTTSVALLIPVVWMTLYFFMEIVPAERRIQHAGNARVSTLSLEWVLQLRALELFPLAFISALLGSGGLMLLYPVAAVLWGRRHALSLAASIETLLKPIASPLWKRPEVAQLLRKPAGRDSNADRREPQSYHELLAAIAELAGELTGPVRALGSDALAVARRVVASLEALDRELRGLARSADPAEIARLESRLAMPDADRAEETEEQRRMRGLLSDQLELIRRLRARLDAATTRRAHLVSMLRTLWLHLAELRAQNAREVDMSAEVTAPVRELCAEIARRVDASVEIERFLAAESPTRANGP